MKRFTANPPLVLLVAGFGLFAVLAFARSGEAPPPAPWQPVADVAPMPSAENVAPTVHARLMGLKARLVTAPDDTAALLELARLQQDAHQHDAAAEHYERFLALSPRNHQVWLDLANIYAGAGRWDEARATSERMLAHYPGDPSATYNLGAIAANQGQTDEARRRWTAVRDGDDAKLAEQAAASLAQLSGAGNRPARPSASPRPPNPHIAGAMGRPLVAHRTSVLSPAE